MMKGSYICARCGKSLASSQSLWNHKQRCKSTSRPPLDEKDIYRIMGQPQPTPSPYSKDAKQEGSEKMQNLSRKLNTASSNSLDFQPIGKKPSPPTSKEEESKNSENETDTEEDDKSSLGSLRIDDDSDVSPAEDDEDDNMNRKVWRVIVHWGKSNDCNNAFDAFKFFFRFNQALDHDAIIEQLMDSVHGFRDDGISFKESLARALKKRKYLIYKAVRRREQGSDEESSSDEQQSDDESGDMDIWEELCRSDGDILETLRKYILFCRSLKRDPIFRSVKEVMQNCMQDIDPMHSDEALDHAIDEKSASIIEAVNAATQHLGSGLFLSPHKGRGIDDDNEDDEMHEKIWEIIALKNYLDELSSVKFFTRLCQNIDHDHTFQRVWNKTQALVDDAVTFKQALDKTIEKEKSLIYRAFANAKEEKCSSGGDEGDIWCLMLQEIEEDNFDELDAFKMYILYYQSIKRDNVFRAIMKTLVLVRGDMDFEEALNFAVERNKSLILQAIKKARKEWSPATANQQPGLLY